DGDIALEITGLPPDFAVSSPVVIAAGQSSANAVVYAAPDAPKPNEQNNHASQVTAMINGSPHAKQVGNLGTIKLAPRGPVRVRIEPAELTIAPGSSVTAKLK